MNGQPSMTSEWLRVLTISVEWVLRNSLMLDVDQRAFDVVELQYYRDRSEGFQTKSRANSLFRSPGDKESDVRYPVYIVGEYRQNGGGRFLVLALVQGIDGGQSRNSGSLERANDEFLHLRAKGFSSGVRVRRQNPKQCPSEAWLLRTELRSGSFSPFVFAHCLPCREVGTSGHTQPSRAMAPCTHASSLQIHPSIVV